MYTAQLTVTQTWQVLSFVLRLLDFNICSSGDNNLKYKMSQKLQILKVKW